MATISLNGRVDEILSKMNKRDSSLIVNNLIARSFTTGLFLKECSLILNSKDMSLMDEILKNEKKEVKMQTRIKKEIKTDEGSKFEGFD